MEEQRLQADQKVETARNSTAGIFLGSGGDNIARDIITEFKPDECPGFHILAENTDGPTHKVHFPDDDSYVIEWRKANAFQDLIMGSGNGAGGDPQVGRQAAEAQDVMAKNVEFLSKHDNGMFVTTLGGGTGGGGGPVIAEMCKDKPAVAIVTIPDPEEEGVERYVRATQALHEIRRYVTTVEISNAYISEYLDTVLSTPEGKAQVKAYFKTEIDPRMLTEKQLFRMQNRYGVVPMIKFIHRLLRVPGTVRSSDLSNWRNFIKKGKHLVVGWVDIEINLAEFKDATSEKIKGMIEVYAETIMKVHFQTQAVALNGKAMIFLADGPIPFIIKRGVKIELKKRICGDDQDRLSKFEVMENATEREDGQMQIVVAIIADSAANMTASYQVPTAVQVETPPPAPAIVANEHKKTEAPRIATGSIDFTVEGKPRREEVPAHLAKRFNEITAATSNDQAEKIYCEVERYREKERGVVELIDRSWESDFSLDLDRMLEAPAESNPSNVQSITGKRRRGILGR
jgi:hypothetical protein